MTSPLTARATRAHLELVHVAAAESAAAVSLDGNWTICAASPAFTALAGRETHGVDFLEFAAAGREDLVRAFLLASTTAWSELPLPMFPDALGVLFDYRLRARRTALGVVVGVERGGASTEALNTTLLELNNELIGTRRELAGRNKRLAELDRLKDEFLATVTHDLKTPLTSIIGYAELLAETPNDGDLAAAAAATIVRNGGRLLEMVDELLLGAQIASGQYVPVLEPVRLDELAAAVVEASGPKAAEKSITITIDAATVEVQGDRGKLEQLLENLVSNAVKYTPAGGTVHVRVAPTDGVAVVEVVDSGIGIAPDELPKVFERFFRAANGRNEATGTGIGLANAKAVAEAHGGRIVLTSELGSGSTFALELPLPG